MDLLQHEHEFVDNLNCTATTRETSSESVGHIRTENDNPEGSGIGSYPIDGMPNTAISIGELLPGDQVNRRPADCEPMGYTGAMEALPIIPQENNSVGNDLALRNDTTSSVNIQPQPPEQKFIVHRNCNLFSHGHWFK